jgi:hypothetical protein
VGNRLGANKDIEKLARRAKKQGWEVEVTGGNHLRFISPEGEVVTSGMSVCQTSIKKVTSQLRKAGLAA